MNLPLFEPTYSVSQLCAEIREVLGEAFTSVWVVGEAQRVRPSQRGHLYFELVEKGERDEIVGKLDAVIWERDLRRVQKLLAQTDQRLAEGVQLRCRGNLDFYPPTGKLQLAVREVDPLFTLGLLEHRRRETLAALAAAGLLERNRELALAELPLSIALITSAGSAAYHDFLSGLRESGYGFRIVFLHASVQGREAEREVVSALAALARARTRIDCAVLIRGGGSRTDLAVFDSRAIAEAIARAPFPVLTGLGHETDRAIADQVAHLSFKTPTKVAEFLVDRVGRLEAAVAELGARLRREAPALLASAREELGRAEGAVGLARMRLGAAAARIAENARALARLGRGALRRAARAGGELRKQLLAAAPRGLERAEQRRRRLGERVGGTARAHLRQAAAQIEGRTRLAAQLDPQRILERGFSITRDPAGRLLRRVDQVTTGGLISTRLAAGSLTSRVERRTEDS
ncbi:MAG TPA: exodeoxyribonuclease VII large subunit [Thermoanaerobaculia bacterium]|nr:exodeoxyribonuclease VII large subunit [Thermoanaerobaculia bacterium]